MRASPLKMFGLAVSLAVCFPGCGGSGSDGQTAASVPHRPARATGNVLPIDESRQRPLRRGQWLTQPGAPVVIRFSITGPGWVGAHRGDISWQLHLGPRHDPRGLYIEVDYPTDSASQTVRQLHRIPGLTVLAQRRARIAGLPATRLDTKARHALAIPVMGGFQQSRNEIGHVYVAKFHGATVVVDEGAQLAKDFRKFAPRAAQVMRSMRA